MNNSNKKLLKYNFKKCITVFVGLPFAGKSTLGLKVSECSNLINLDVDRARLKIFGKQKRLSDSQEKEIMLKSYIYNHKLALQSLKRNRPVILEATYSRKVYHEMLKELAKEVDAPLRVFLLNAQIKDIIERIKVRKENGDLSVVISLEAFKEVRHRYLQIEGVSLKKINTSFPITLNIKQILNSLSDLLTTVN